jgi:hypothetical protein
MHFVLCFDRPFNCDAHRVNAKGQSARAR